MGKGKESESGGEALSIEEEGYKNWKSLVPVLYDWFTNHNIVWPSLSCRWGPVIDQGQYKKRQRLYLSEQTDGSFPNTLMILNCDVVKPRVAAAEHISEFNEETRSPFVWKYKTLIHPGEVNRIRELPQNSRIVATHTDSPDVLVWDLEAQPNRHCAAGAVASRPDVILTGHKENAESADSTVCMFDRRKLTAGRVASLVHKFEGHKSPVLSTQWCPDKASVFASASEDGFLNIWDFEKVGNKRENIRRPASPGLFFQHAGHRGPIVDFHWNPAELWTIASVSDDAAVRGGGGSLQVWRMMDLIYRPEEEVLDELNTFKEHLTKCSPSDKCIKSSD